MDQHCKIYFRQDDFGHVEHHQHLLLHDVPADHHDLPEHAGLLLQGRLENNSQNYLFDIILII